MRRAKIFRFSDVEWTLVEEPLRKLQQSELQSTGFREVLESLCQSFLDKAYRKYVGEYRGHQGEKFALKKLSRSLAKFRDDVLAYEAIVDDQNLLREVLPMQGSPPRLATGGN